MDGGMVAYSPQQHVLPLGRTCCIRVSYIPALACRLCFPSRLCPRVDHPAGEAERSRKRGHLLHVEPRRAIEFMFVDTDLSAQVARGEPDHELMRKRPGLTALVDQVGDLHADLFVDLAV